MKSLEKIYMRLLSLPDMSQKKWINGLLRNIVILGVYLPNIGVSLPNIGVDLPN